MIAHCLFEQSGTFKNEFKKLGIEAYDYDILNDYGQTDYQIDLFSEIGGGYEGKPSIFDNMKKEDLIMAFFPCTRFQEKNYMMYKGTLHQMQRWSMRKKLTNAMDLHRELDKHYSLITKLAVIVMDRGLRMVIENPLSHPHYLTEFWALEPEIIDKDRTLNGDIYKKPTQYWFIGFEPYQNLVFEPLDYIETKIIEDVKGVDRQKVRSEITPQYANRFIRQYLIDEVKT